MKKHLLILLLLVTASATAQIPKPKKGTFINDYANVLDAADIKALNQKIYLIQKEAGVQLAVIIVKEIPAPYNIKTFATQIGRQWHVGNNKRGLVYVTVTKQHQQRLAVAKNLDTVFTTDKSKAILAATKDAYANGDYAGGLTIVVNKIHSSLVKPAVASAPTVISKQPNENAVNNITEPKKEGGAFTMIIIALIILIAVILIVRYFYKKNKLRQAQHNDYPTYYNNRNDGPQQPSGNFDGRQQQGNGSSGFGGISSGVGGFVAGAAAGYGARYLQDKMSENDNNNEHHTTGDQNNAVNENHSSINPVTSNNVTEDNNSDNWGNWGNQDSSADDSGFADDEDQNSRKATDESAFYDDSSLDDNGFSDDDGGWSDDSGFSDDGGSSDD